MGDLENEAARSVTISPPGRRPAIEGRNLSKRYGATQALRDVSVALEYGQVTALAGENGAGKSTLIRLLTGVERPDDGVLMRDGEPVRLASRHEATAAGIFCVYQDQPYVPRFTVHEQMFLGYEEHFRRNGFVSDTLMRRTCGDVLGELGLTWIEPGQRMGSMSPGAREVVALVNVIVVARLVEIDNPVIMLDEPTSALSVEELEFLKRFIDRLRERSAVMFVSHRVAEVLDWSDAIWVLRDGRGVDFMTRETASSQRVFRAMGGGHQGGDAGEPAAKEAAPVPVAVTRPPSAGARFTAGGVRLREKAAGFDFHADVGEIVGLAGVEGSGKEDFLRFCIGLHGGAAECPTVELDGTPHPRHLTGLLSSGVVYLSGERQRDGVFGRLSIAENIAVARRVVAGRSELLVNRSTERARAERMMATLAVKARDPSAPLSSLSGGNQQKVLLARCLELEPRVMLLDNVTRGVDVGTKESIYELFRSLAADGMSIVLASDDLDELILATDRIVVFKDGSVAREFDNRRRDAQSVEVLAEMV